MTMSVETNSWIELIAKNYQFYVFLFSTFVICMGVARWWGKKSSHEREKTRRKKANLPIASLASLGGSVDQSFTYSSLFNGGLLGVYTTLVLFTYVVFMEAFGLFWKLIDYTDVSQASFIDKGSISILNLYPILMISLFCFIIPLDDASQNSVGQSYYSRISAVLIERKVISVIVILCLAVTGAS